MSNDIQDMLRAVVGNDYVSSTPPVRLVYSGDMWPRRQIQKQMGIPFDMSPDCVVWPKNSAEVCEVLRLCAITGTPVVPYGAGSGVCGGTVPTRGGVVVDVRRLDRVGPIDTAARTVEVQAGVVGHLLEQALGEKGFTLGHFPSSILCSTVGGWLATRSAGQLSSRYGKIEDMVLGLEVALPSGKSVTTGCFGAISTVDWTQVFVGSEGTLGIITRALLKLHPAPTTRSFRGFAFPDLKSGFSAIRAIMQDGVCPSVLRLYDPVDALIAGRHVKPKREGHPSGAVQKWLGRILGLHSGTSSDPQHSTDERLDNANLESSLTYFDRVAPMVSKARDKTLQFALSNPTSINRIAGMFARKSILIVGVEGGMENAAARMTTAKEIAARFRADDLGDGPGLHWLEKRYAVSFKQSQVFGSGAFVDTMEVSTTWSHLSDLYMAVKQAVEPFAFVMAHFSHAYGDGCSIYFTFTGWRSSPEESIRTYDNLWNAAMAATQAHHGTLSHHHGIGLLKRDYMEAEIPGGSLVFRALKETLDPRGIMNPDKVFVSSTPTVARHTMQNTGGSRG